MPDVEVDAYRLENPMFPITTTLNQFYGEYDVEAYRQLGDLNTTQMVRLAALQGPSWPPAVSSRPWERRCT